MKVVFRVDASLQIGTGHVMRCLTLADALRAHGVQSSFICRAHVGHLAEVVHRRGYKVCLMPAEHAAVPDSGYEDVHSHIDGFSVDWQADAKQVQALLLGEAKPHWLIVDHYGIDANWEAAMRPIGARIMVIDDLADRPHDCDILLDQNYYAGLETRYAGLVPDHAECLLGPAYLLLRPEFYKARSNLRKRDGTIKRIMVFFGGSDPTNQTQRTLDAIDLLDQSEIKVDVVVGSTNKHRNEVKLFCEARPWANYYCQISDMAGLIAAADLGFGAGGTAMWERCVLGLPTATVVLADNQLRTTEDVAKTGAIFYLGRADSLSIADYPEITARLLSRPDDLLVVSNQALQLINGRSNGAELIVGAMKKVSV